MHSIFLAIFILLVMSEGSSGFSSQLLLAQQARAAKFERHQIASAQAGASTQAVALTQAEAKSVVQGAVEENKNNFLKRPLENIEKHKDDDDDENDDCVVFSPPKKKAFFSPNTPDSGSGSDSDSVLEVWEPIPSSESATNVKSSGSATNLNRGDDSNNSGTTSTAQRKEMEQALRARANHFASAERTKSTASPLNSVPAADPTSFSVISQNLWFDENCQPERMKSVVKDVVTPYSPNVLMMQELTDDLRAHLFPLLSCKGYRCFEQNSSAPYRVALAIKTSGDAAVEKSGTRPFSSTNQGRGLVFAILKHPSGNETLVCTAHLESYVGKEMEKYNAQIRASQVLETMAFTTRLRRDRPSIKNIIFGGDCNWDDTKTPRRKAESLVDTNMADLCRTDFATWSDVWLSKHPHNDKNSDDDLGYTYDPKKNEMLSSKSSLRRRFDRILVDVTNTLSLDDVKIIIPPIIEGARRPITGYKSHVVSRYLPCIASDHFGLMASFKF